MHFTSLNLKFYLFFIASCLLACLEHLRGVHFRVSDPIFAIGIVAEPLHKSCIEHGRYVARHVYTNPDGLYCDLGPLGCLLYSHRLAGVNRQQRLNHSVRCAVLTDQHFSFAGLNARKSHIGKLFFIFMDGTDRSDILSKHGA